MTDDAGCFLDSNICLYALSDEDDEKAKCARALVDALGSGIFVSPQVINEVCVNLKRKSSMNEVDVRTLIESFFLDYVVIELSKEVLLYASNLRERHSFSFWDSLIASCAVSANAKILYSEDMQDGFVLDNKLKIINPFTNLTNYV